jgi:hypothetical protein
MRLSGPDPTLRARQVVFLQGAHAAGVAGVEVTVRVASWQASTRTRTPFLSLLISLLPSSLPTYLPIYLPVSVPPSLRALRCNIFDPRDDSPPKS